MQVAASVVITDQAARRFLVGYVPVSVLEDGHILRPGSRTAAQSAYAMTAARQTRWPDYSTSLGDERVQDDDLPRHTDTVPSQSAAIYARTVSAKVPIVSVEASGPADRSFFLPRGANCQARAAHLVRGATRHGGSPCLVLKNWNFFETIAFSFLLNKHYSI